MCQLFFASTNFSINITEGLCFKCIRQHCLALGNPLVSGAGLATQKLAEVSYSPQQVCRLFEAYKKVSRYITEGLVFKMLLHMQNLPILETDRPDNNQSSPLIDLESYTPV